MKTNVSRIATLSLAIMTLSAGIMPVSVSARSVSAIKGADEKNFDNPASRCDTPSMRKLHAQNIGIMKQDIESLGDKAGEGAVKDYQWKLDVIWDAMTEPYCGYGSRGVSAAKKSYNKSIDRARGEFLASAKKIEATLKNK